MPPRAEFTPRGGESWRDPFAMYRELRDWDPVHHVPDNGEGEDYWVLSRFEHVFAASVDAATWSSASGLTFSYGEMERLGLEAPLVMMDPPAHTALRKLTIKRLTPRQSQALDPMVREFVAGRIDRMGELGECDVVAELLRPLASLVVAHALGVPPSDRAVFERWTDAIVSAGAEGSEPQASEVQQLGAGEAVGEMFAYFQKLIAARRADPQPDMISSLVHGELAGGEPVSMAAILGVCFTMVTGGNDTVQGLLGGALELLTRHPDQRAILVETPERMPGAVEELLRLTSPVQGLARTAMRDVEIEGVTVPKGRKALLLYASANRDEREFGPSAGECDLTRKIRRHLAFSYGPHHCIGAAAARLQGRIVLEEILSRCPDFSVDAFRGRYAPGAFVRRFERLPFSV